MGTCTCGFAWRTRTCASRRLPGQTDVSLVPLADRWKPGGSGRGSGVADRRVVVRGIEKHPARVVVRAPAADRAEEPQLSFLIGPPNAGLKSAIFLIALGVVNPRALRSSVKLLPAIDSFANAPNTDPLNALPPSFGTMFMRTPPFAWLRPKRRGVNRHFLVLPMLAT